MTCKPLFLNVKTGLKCSDPVFLVYDKNGVFYRKINTGSNCFNLPKGQYYTNNNVEKIPFIDYKATLRKPDFKVKTLKPKIKFSDNPHKATINTNTQLITIDKSLLKERAKMMFIYFHEIGHLFYNTEKKCDDFTVYCCLKIGLNPSQIAKLSINSLSKKNIDRIINTFQKTAQ